MRVFSAKDQPAKIPDQCRNFRKQQSTDFRGLCWSDRGCADRGRAGNEQLEKLRVRNQRNEITTKR